jgi:hypothetical protein
LLLLTAFGAGTIGFLPREAEGAGEADADAPPRRTEATRLIAAGAGAGAVSVVEVDAVGSEAMFATGAVVICATGAGVEASAEGAASVAGCSVGVESDAVAADAPPRPPLPPLPLVPVPRALPVAVLGGILVYSCPGLLLSWCCYTIGECDSVF